MQKPTIGRDLNDDLVLLHRILRNPKRGLKSRVTEVDRLVSEIILNLQIGRYERHVTESYHLFARMIAIPGMN